MWYATTLVCEPMLNFGDIQLHISVANKKDLEVVIYPFLCNMFIIIAKITVVDREGVKYVK